MADRPRIFHLENEAQTHAFSRALSMVLTGGDQLHLTGDLGTGKTVIARAIIRHLCADREMEVPSPTFSLVQAYEPMEPVNGITLIQHADLYRIGDPSEVLELGIADTDANCLTLIEWPQRGETYLQEPAIAITITEGDAPEARHIAVLTDDIRLARIDRSLRIEGFLAEHWAPALYRKPLQGDASTRSYETVSDGAHTRILMNAPRQPDGPPIRAGKPYSQIAKLAEDVRAFCGVRAILADAGLSAPQIHAADLEDGLLLLEDLGRESILDPDGVPIAERYLESARMLAGFHRQAPVDAASLADGSSHTVPPYDREAMLIEVELLLDWYAPRFRGAPISADDRHAFLGIWNQLIDGLGDKEMRLCMRDFHSPNIIWLDGRKRTMRVGVIDFQDAVMGPSAYDLISLAQDARVTISRELETAIINAYIEAREAEPDFDTAAFRQTIAIMGAQRASKILGIFVRLDERDGKPDYLKHLPRLTEYLHRNFSHPVLGDYARWFERVIGDGHATENALPRENTA